MVDYIFIHTYMYAGVCVCVFAYLHVYITMLYVFVKGYNGNTLWLRDTVRQTSRGKSAAAGRPRPLTSRGMSAWPYRVVTKYAFYPVRTHKMLNNCPNCALKWEIPLFDGELFIHTCMTSPAKWADVTCQVKPESRRPEPLFNITKTALGT